MHRQLIELVGATVGLCWSLGVFLFALIVTLAALSRTLRACTTSSTVARHGIPPTRLDTPAPTPINLICSRVGSGAAVVAHVCSLVLWLGVLAALPEDVKHHRTAHLKEACKLQSALQLLLILHWMLALVWLCCKSGRDCVCNRQELYV